MASNKYAVETAFRLIDRTTEPLAKIGVKGNAIGKQLKKDFMKAQDQLASIGKAAGKAALAIGAVGSAAVVAGITVAAKQFVEFDAAATAATAKFKDLDVKSENYAESLKKVGQTARDVAAITEYNAVDTAGALDKMAMAGLTSEQSMKLLMGTTNLATAAGMDLTTAVDIATDSLGAFGLMSEDASQLQKNLDRVSDVMAKTTNMFNTDMPGMFEAIKKGGPAFTSAGQSVESFSSLIGVMASSGVKGSEAGTQLRNMMLSLANPTEKAAKQLERMGIITQDSHGNYLDIIDIIGQFETATKNMGSAEKAAALSTIFGSRTVTGMNILLQEGAGKLRDYRKELESAGGAAADIAAAMRGSIKNKIEVLKSALTELGFKFVESFQEKGVGLIEKLTDAVSKFDPQPIINGVTMAGNVIIKLVEIVWKLRAPILAVAAAVAVYRGGMLLAALAVNGFTAVQNIAKGIQLAAAFITGNQTKAMALYKAGTMGATVQTTLFWIRQKAVQGLNFTGTLIKQGAAFVALKARLIGAKIATVAYSVAQKACAAATAIMNGAMTIANALFVASPIGRIVLAIGALIAVIVLCAKNWDKITAALQVAWEWIKNVAGMIWDGLCNAFNSLTGFIQRNSEKVLAFIAIFTGPFGFIISIVKELKDNWGAVTEAFKTDGITAGLKKLGGVILSGILAPTQGFLEMLSNIPIIGDKIVPAADKIKAFRDQLKGVETENTIVQNVVPGSITNLVPETLTQTVYTTARAIPPLNNGMNNRTITAPGRASFPGETTPVPPQLNRVTPPAITRTMTSIPAPQVDPVTIRVGKVEGLNEQLHNLTADVTVVENVVPGKINNVVPPIVDQPRRATASPAVPSFSGVNLNNRTITAAATAPTPPMTTAEQRYYTERTNREQVDIDIRTEPGTTATIARQPRSPNVRVPASGGNNAR
jgi:TP901 family phage tail tape measure protein